MKPYLRKNNYHMNTNERFDQLESLLVDLARKVDQQGEQIAQIILALNRQGEAIARQGEAIIRQERRLDNLSEQIDDIINILKISAARHIETGQRQDAMLDQIKEQGSRIDSALNVQLQMLHLMRATSTKVDDLTGRLEPLEGQEPRIKRLEDELFRAAS